MEVRIDSDGLPPPDTFVSMRVGDVQKQSRLDKSRTYKFPPSKDERGCLARIEVFKRIGNISVDLEKIKTSAKGPRIEVPCNHPDFSNIALNLDVMGIDMAKAPRPVSREKKLSRSQKRFDEAQQYIMEFSLESLLADAMREVIRDKPDNPYKFLSNVILRQGESMTFNDRTLRPKTVPNMETSQDWFPSKTAAPTAGTIPSTMAGNAPSMMAKIGTSTAEVQPFKGGYTFYNADNAGWENSDGITKSRPRETTKEPAAPVAPVAPVASLQPFREYYKANILSAGVAGLQLFPGYKPVAKPKPKPVASLTPFATYYGANFTGSSVIEGLALFPSCRPVAAPGPPVTSSKPALTQAPPPIPAKNAPTQAPPPIAAKSVPPQNVPAEALTPAKSIPAKISAPPVTTVLPFAEYYRSNFPGDVCAGLQLFPGYKPVEPAPVPQKPAKFQPSVGTWLVPAPIVEDYSKDIGFSRMASVGTWLAPRFVQEEESPAETAQAPTTQATGSSSVAAPEVPFVFRPSVGSWLVRKPPQVERPWFYQKRTSKELGENVEYVRGLQAVISEKDQEVERLKAQIAAMMETMSPTSAKQAQKAIMDIESLRTAVKEDLINAAEDGSLMFNARELAQTNKAAMDSLRMEAMKNLSDAGSNGDLMKACILASDS